MALAVVVAAVVLEPEPAGGHQAAEEGRPVDDLACAEA
jgi:hypothetical protein